MPHARSHIGRDTVGPERLTPNLRRGRYCFEQFMFEPTCFLKGALAAPDGSTLAEMIVDTGRHRFEYVNLGTQTLLYPVLASDGGYDWGRDQTLAEGTEINFGGLKEGHPRNFKPRGTTAPVGEDFFARILLSIEDASGANIVFGVRKVAAYAATLTEYSDIAGIQIFGDDSSTTAAISIVKNLNNAGATDYTATATTLAGVEDGATIELEVRGSNGTIRFYVNGVERFETSFTPDTDDVFSPVLRVLHSTDLAGRVKTLVFECGHPDDRQEGSLSSLLAAVA